jgi:hypothetical protein
MKRRSLFEKDFEVARSRFPKLSARWNAEMKSWIVTGELDICDTQGNYWETFNIIMIFSKSYPYCIPVVIEKSELIPREIEWHISKEGICCIDFSYSLQLQSKKGIQYSDFILNKVYSYFANQLYKMSEGKYAGEEYGHHFDGTLQFYIEELGFKDERTLVEVLKAVSSGVVFGRNDLCPCGGGKKLKHCHLISIEDLKSLGKDTVLKDLQLLNAYLISK